MQRVFTDRVDALRRLFAIGEVVHEDLEFFVAHRGENVRYVAIHFHHHTNDALVLAVQHTHAGASLESLAELSGLERQRFVKFLVGRVDGDAAVCVNSIHDTLEVLQITLDDDDLIASHELQIGLALAHSLGQGGERALALSTLPIDVFADGELLQLVQSRRVGKFHGG